MTMGCLECYFRHQSTHGNPGTLMFSSTLASVWLGMTGPTLIGNLRLNSPIFVMTDPTLMRRDQPVGRVCEHFKRSAMRVFIF